MIVFNMPNWSGVVIETVCFPGEIIWVGRYVHDPIELAFILSFIVIVELIIISMFAFGLEVPLKIGLLSLNDSSFGVMIWGFLLADCVAVKIGNPKVPEIDAIGAWLIVKS